MLTTDVKDALNDFLAELNQEPGYFETGEEGYKHIPIQILEDDLNQVFNGLVQYEQVQLVEIFNSVTVTVRIKVFHPIFETWMHYDGVASAAVEMITQGKYADTTKVIKLNEEKLASPLAFAEAQKNAARRIGKRFGRDLNRELKTVKIPTALDQPFDISAIKNESDLQAAVVGGQVSKQMIPTIRKMIEGLTNGGLEIDPIVVAETFIAEASEKKEKSVSKTSKKSV